ncbi:lipopolysaccharide kinase InaA family protein [Aurantivibrio plasticivorans]
MNYSDSDKASVQKVVAALLAEQQLPTAASQVTSSSSTRVATCELEAGAVFVKVFCYRSVIDSLKQLLRGSRAARSVCAADRLMNVGLNTPAVLDVGTKQGYSWLVTSAVPAVSLGLYLDKFLRPPLGPNKLRWKRMLLGALGQVVGRLHGAGIVHGDLRLNNVLIDSKSTSPCFYIIDNERNTYFKRAIPISKIIKNLVQLSMLAPRFGTKTDRLRFLTAYFGVYQRFSRAEQRALIAQVYEVSEHRMKKLLRKPMSDNPLDERAILNVPHD